MKIIERIEGLITQSGKTANAVLTDCKLSHNALVAWKSGKAKPSLDAAVKLSEYFGVSLDYLVGRDDVRPPTVQEIIYSQLSEQEIHLVNAYRAAPIWDKAVTQIASSVGRIAPKRGRRELLTKQEIEKLRNKTHE